MGTIASRQRLADFPSHWLTTDCLWLIGRVVKPHVSPLAMCGGRPSADDLPQKRCGICSTLSGAAVPMKYLPPSLRHKRPLSLASL
jgi:hypothetical protein